MASCSARVRPSFPAAGRPALGWATAVRAVSLMMAAQLSLEPKHCLTTAYGLRDGFRLRGRGQDHQAAGRASVTKASMAPWSQYRVLPILHGYWRATDA